MKKKFSLRHILTISLVLLATVPAALVLWMMARASSSAVEDLAGKILTQVAALVQTGTEAHVQQVHDVLDGVFPERLAGAELERARGALRSPAQFEPMAFALTRQTTDVPVMHFANLHGEYFGLESMAAGAKISIRRPDGAGRLFFDARFPGDRSHPNRPKSATSSRAARSGIPERCAPRTASSRRCRSPPNARS
jgi:hypothetical protein